MRSLFLIFLLSSLANASGPLFSHKDRLIDQEFNNAYHDIEKVLKGNVLVSSTTTSSATIKSLIVSTAAISSGTFVNFVGTQNNSSACQGCVGEYVSSTVTSLANFAATGVYSDLTSIQLTAGDWSVSAMVDVFGNGATVTDWQAGIGTASGTSGAGIANGDTALQNIPPSGTGWSSATVAKRRYSISVTTNFYLKIFSTYSAATPQAVGRLSARRER